MLLIQSTSRCHWIPPPVKEQQQQQTNKPNRQTEEGGSQLVAYAKWNGFRGFCSFVFVCVFFLEMKQRMVYGAFSCAWWKQQSATELTREYRSQGCYHEWEDSSRPCHIFGHESRHHVHASPAAAPNAERNQVKGSQHLLQLAIPFLGILVDAGLGDDSFCAQQASLEAIHVQLSSHGCLLASLLPVT